MSQTSRIYQHKVQIQYHTIHDIFLYSAPLGSYIKSNICSLQNLVTQISWWPSVYIRPIRSGWRRTLRASTNTNELPHTGLTLNKQRNLFM